MKDFRTILRQAIKTRLDKDCPALLFSGGTDSLAILWCLLDLGIKPVCYTFKLQAKSSDDMVAAKEICNYWNIPLKQIIIPTQTLENRKESIKEVVRFTETYRKTAIECLWPFFYIFPEIKEELVFSGLNADDLYGSSKSIAIKCSKNPDLFRETRITIMTKPESSGWCYFNDLAQFINLDLACPYRNMSIINFFLRYNWVELNKPKQKMPVVLSFAKEYNEFSCYRKNNNLQVGSGIREYFAELLENPETNPTDCKTMVKYYREIYNGTIR